MVDWTQIRRRRIIDDPIDGAGPQGSGARMPYVDIDMEALSRNARRMATRYASESQAGSDVKARIWALTGGRSLNAEQRKGQYDAMAKEVWHRYNMHHSTDYRASDERKRAFELMDEHGIPKHKQYALGAQGRLTVQRAQELIDRQPPR